MFVFQHFVHGINMVLLITVYFLFRCSFRDISVLLDWILLKVTWVGLAPINDFYLCDNNPAQIWDFYDYNYV